MVDERDAEVRTPRPRRNYVDIPREESLMTPAEVAAVFRVDPKTVTRWAVAGRLASITTPGGHRRFFKSDVMAALRAERGGSANA
jgi:excisionase family DNA binding protein